MKRFSNTAARLVIAGLFVSRLFGSSGAQAQQLEVGAGLGGMLYKGELSPTLNPRFYRPAASLFFRYNASRSFSLRAGLGIGQVAADDKYASDPFQRARGIFFRNTIKETTLDLEYNFRNYKMLRNVKNWTPYVFGGLGFYNYGKLGNSSPETGLTNKLMFPLGVGVKYEIKRPWSLGFEFGTRFTRTDYLDGVGFTDGTTNRLGQGTVQKDHYTYTAITISYTFYKLTCPE